MSRAILFRGKRIDDGEWIEGYLLKLGKYSFSAQSGLELSTRRFRLALMVLRSI